MNKKLILGIYRNRRFLGHIKSFLILSCVFLLLISFSFAKTNDYGFSVTNLNMNSLDVSKIDTSDTFINWRCDFEVVPSVFSIGDCYCLDTKSSISDSVNTNQADGFGYGNLFECMKFNSFANVKTSSVNFQGSNLKITVKSEEKQSVPTNVLINDVPNSGGTVKCNHDETSELNIYTFYREKPFIIMEKGLNDEYTLPSYIKSGDSIKCQVTFYEGWQKIGSTTSSNSLIIDDTNVVITMGHLAPANARVGDSLYCYGNSEYSVNPSLYSVDHSFYFYKNGLLVSSTSYSDETGLSSPRYAMYNSFEVRNEMSCKYSVEVINKTDSNVINSVQKTTNLKTILSRKLFIPEVSISVR